MIAFLDSLPILSVVTFLPMIGALFILFIRGDDAVVAQQARQVALLATVFTFLLSMVIWVNFDRTTADFQFREQIDWLPDYSISYSMGVDGISVLFVMLSTLLMPICILASWEAITKMVREYMIAFLFLETMILGMFCALDMVLFYVFFEGVLIPMFIIIGVWGGERRVYSAFKFFLFTLTGSVLLLISMLSMYFIVGTTDIPSLMAADFSFQTQLWLWLGMFASFAVKVPMWPVHTWLPDAHVEAPTAGSVILAGVLLKMGAYGFLRFSLPMLPDASLYFTPLVWGLSVIAVIYTSLVALAQKDMKKLIAYSSVAHMGFVTVGIFAATQQAVEGALFQMVSHGLISSALFLCVGVLYDQLHTRLVERYGGLANNMPKYAFTFMVFMLASVGLPGTSGFVGEFLVLTGVFQVSTGVALLTATGVILGATYMLHLYRRVIYGELTKDDVKAMIDLKPREIAIFTPLILGVMWMGLYPAPVLGVMEVSVANLIADYQEAVSEELVNGSIHLTDDLVRLVSR